MSSALQDCIFLEGERQVVGDVSDSLSLLRIPVRAHSTVEGALLDASKYPPMLVIARLCVGQDASAGIRFAKELAAHPVLSILPRLAVYTPAEHPADADELSVFNGGLELPVEFPTFTKKVQKFLDEFTEKNGNYSEDFKKAVEKTPLEEIRANFGSAASPDMGSPLNEDLDRKLIVAYAIQQKVLEALKSHDTFTNARLEEIPQILSGVTREVCGKVDPRKLLSS